MSIGDLVRRMVDDREPRDPSIGGIGGLTADEEVELDDLLNGPHRLCTCLGACAGHMPTERRGLP